MAVYIDKPGETRASSALYPIEDGRIMTGMTQERMAEALGIDVRTLRRYESGQSRTPDALMLRVAELAKCPRLMVDHYKGKYHIADEYMPEVDEVTLAQAVVGLLHALADLEMQNMATTLLSMALDGKIDLTEETDYAWIMTKLDNVRKAVEQLRYHRPEGI